MNPTNQPVSFYGDNSRSTDSALLAGLATRTYDYPGMISADGTSDLRHEVGELKGEIKDAECNLRHDITKAESEIRRDVAKSEADIRAEVLREGQENMAATKDAECKMTREILESRHTLAKDILRSEYENKLAIQTAIKEINTETRHNAERTQDKIDHGFEEVSEKLCECCCEAKVTASEQTGLLNVIANALNVGKVK